MKTNEIKKGARMILRNGWFATMQDNMRGNTRVAEVEGYYTETGSIYAHDIVTVFEGDKAITVEHTPAQLKLKKIVSQL